MALHPISHQTHPTYLYTPDLFVKKHTAKKEIRSSHVGCVGWWHHGRHAARERLGFPVQDLEDGCWDAVKSAEFWFSNFQLTNSKVGCPLGVDFLVLFPCCFAWPKKVRVAQMLTLEQNNEELLGAKVSNINNPGSTLINMAGKCG